MVAVTFVSNSWVLDTVLVLTDFAHAWYVFYDVYIDGWHEWKRGRVSGRMIHQDRVRGKSL